jgi:hypothetical protein
MYVTVRRYKGVTDPTEAARRVNEGFLAIISKVPGFVAYYLVDAGGGVAISTSIFENQSGAEESNKRAADYARENGLIASKAAPDHGWGSCRSEDEIGYRGESTTRVRLPLRI